jgi:hypothetical protein
MLVWHKAVFYEKRNYEGKANFPVIYITIPGNGMCKFCLHGPGYPHEAVWLVDLEEKSGEPGSLT